MPHGQTQSVAVTKTSKQAGPVLRNWLGTVTYQPARYVAVTSIADVQSVVRDTAMYPSPVRAKGSHHSMSHCIVADAGTVIDMRGMNRVVEIDRERLTVTLEAGVYLQDAARALEAHGLQFYVNVELGALTMGSAACCATKDASCFSEAEDAYEYGQASSYALGFKLVDRHGDVIVVDEDNDPELLPVLRSSYGMLGVVCEVTFRVKPIVPLRFTHTEYTLSEFAEHAPQLFTERESHMLYLFPFLDRIVVERRSYDWGQIQHNNLRWRLRNGLRKAVPALVRLTRHLPSGARDKVLDAYSRGLIKVMTSALHGDKSSAAEQIIEYPKQPGRTGYAFSIWGFQIDDFATTLRDYFVFVREYHARTGFRCDLPNVGYGVRSDRSALFSYSRDGHCFTLDPVSTPGPGWTEFIFAYNRFCSEHGGKPLLNQTSDLTPSQTQLSFGPEIAEFLKVRAAHDPTGRFYNKFFRELFESAQRC
jgi:L-gulonolactone oxidase